jgi:DeoR/GlpR family transcriptional regulator of sugar metabolism
MISLQRQKQLLEYIAARESAQVTELSSAFGVSLSTVRRDLNEMEQSGLVRRIHGGVVLAEQRDESPLVQRASRYPEHKRRIGQAAAELVQDGSTIILTAGTTTGAMAPFLKSKRDLTVITNALHVAYQLASYPHINVIVLGGWLRHSESSLLGHLTAQALQDLRADQVFIGAFGLDMEHGLVGTYMQEVETDRRIIAAARKLVVLADHSKFSMTGSVRLASFDVVSTVVTDTEAPATTVEALRARGIEVVQA